ncbi:MAG: TIGR02921 family PEP-CTERM protein [Anaerolineales bacterium]
MMETQKKRTKRDWLFYGLFWSWNIIFLAFMTLGFAPRIIPEMITAVGTDTIPPSFLFNALLLTSIPIFAVVLGLTVLRPYPRRLFALGYAVEGPFMLMLAVRFFAIRDGTPATSVLMILAGLGMAAFLWYLLDKRIEGRGGLQGRLQLAGLTIMLLASLYVAVWIAFYAAPLAVEALRGILDILTDLPRFLGGFALGAVELFTERLLWVPFTLLGIVLALYTATVIILMPVVVPYLSISAWRQTVRALAGRRNWFQPAVVVVVTIILCALVLVPANSQPQHRAFAMLESPPATLAEAVLLLDKEETLRRGLVNAYLAPFRYISATGEVFHVRRIYQDAFALSEQDAALVQGLYENVVKPFLYSPVHPPEKTSRRDNVAFQREPQEAAELYQRFFDEPITQGERDEIVDAVRSTWSVNQAEAAWLAVDDREVYLASQTIYVQEHGDWAEVELYEIYQNQTSDRQEIVYYFNLPESAVLTGVYLGNNPDRNERFEYQVAPRGAAQAVYRNETRRNIDPALLEQIGPRQYRLRVFPVPPVQMTWNEQRAHTMVEEAPPLHLWLTYQTMVNADTWPLPRLAHKHNVYWDEDTERTINGVTVKADEENWLPESVPIAGTIELQSHRVDFLGGESVVAIPVDRVALPELPQAMRVAVVLDRSRSMAVRADEVTSTFTQLEETLGSYATIDVYLTASSYRGEAPELVSYEEIDPGELVYFGGQNAGELLAQYEILREGREYDAVLVFTDGSGYELGEPLFDFPIPDAPVWMVHQGSDLPLGYDDKTLEAIQASGGGVVSDLGSALTRLVFSMSEGEEVALAEAWHRDVLDGYLWAVLPTEQAEAVLGTPKSDGDFSALAARRYILAEMQRNRGSLDQVEMLDKLHDLAQQEGIVTPYPSMIVLVAQSQQLLIDHLSEEADRYKREVEVLGETVPSTPAPLVGVPEPHEWLLLGLAVLMLVWLVSQRRLSWDRR